MMTEQECTRNASQCLLLAYRMTAADLPFWLELAEDWMRAADALGSASAPLAFAGVRFLPARNSLDCPPREQGRKPS